MAVVRSIKPTIVNPIVNPILNGTDFVMDTIPT
jgi:hypothetical protein